MRYWHGQKVQVGYQYPQYLLTFLSKHSLIETNVFVSSRISEKKFLKHFANVYDDAER